MTSSGHSSKSIDSALCFCGGFGWSSFVATSSAQRRGERPNPRWTKRGTTLAIRRYGSPWVSVTRWHRRGSGTRPSPCAVSQLPDCTPSRSGNSPAVTPLTAADAGRSFFPSSGHPDGQQPPEPRSVPLLPSFAVVVTGGSERRPSRLGSTSRTSHNGPPGGPVQRERSAPISSPAPWSGSRPRPGSTTTRSRPLSFPLYIAASALARARSNDWRPGLRRRRCKPRPDRPGCPSGRGRTGTPRHVRGSARRLPRPLTRRGSERWWHWPGDSRGGSGRSRAATGSGRTWRYRQLLADATTGEAEATGPGGQVGAALSSCAAGRSPVVSTSDRPQPGPVTTDPTPTIPSHGKRSSAASRRPSNAPTRGPRQGQSA